MKLTEEPKGAHILTGGKEACEGGKTKPIGVSRKPKQSELPDDLVVTIGRQFQEASQARTEKRLDLADREKLAEPSRSSGNQNIQDAGVSRK